MRRTRDRSGHARHRSGRGSSRRRERGVQSVINDAQPRQSHRLQRAASRVVDGEVDPQPGDAGVWICHHHTKVSVGHQRKASALWGEEPFHRFQELVPPLDVGFDSAGLALEAMRAPDCSQATSPLAPARQRFADPQRLPPQGDRPLGTQRSWRREYLRRPRRPATPLGRCETSG